MRNSNDFVAGESDINEIYSVAAVQKATHTHTHIYATVNALLFAHTQLLLDAVGLTYMSRLLPRRAAVLREAAPGWLPVSAGALKTNPGRFPSTCLPAVDVNSKGWFTPLALGSSLWLK